MDIHAFLIALTRQHTNMHVRAHTCAHTHTFSTPPTPAGALVLSSRPHSAKAPNPTDLVLVLEEVTTYITTTSRIIDPGRDGVSTAWRKSLRSDHSSPAVWSTGSAAHSVANSTGASVLHDPVQRVAVSGVASRVDIF